MEQHRIFSTSFASVYPLYVRKAEGKNRTKEEVDEIIFWLTGYDKAGLEKQIRENSDFQTFFEQAPEMNPRRRLRDPCGRDRRPADAKDTVFGQIN